MPRATSGRAIDVLEPIENRDYLCAISFSIQAAASTHTAITHSSCSIKLSQSTN